MRHRYRAEQDSAADIEAAFITSPVLNADFILPLWINAPRFVWRSHGQHFDFDIYRRTITVIHGLSIYAPN